MLQPDTPGDHPKPKRPLTIGAGAVVMHEGRVLLVRNVHGFTKGRYLLPAGRVNSGELPDHAAARQEPDPLKGMGLHRWGGFCPSSKQAHLTRLS